MDAGNGRKLPVAPVQDSFGGAVVPEGRYERSPAMNRWAKIDRPYRTAPAQPLTDHRTHPKHQDPLKESSADSVMHPWHPAAE